MMFLFIPRIIMRHILALFVKITLKKHHPLVIMVNGDKNSSIITDFIYTAALKRYNPRKTLERAESEFAIPLMIIGYLYYPKNLIEWIKFISRLGIQTFWVAPYKHMLIIQTREITPSIYKYWVKTIQPALIINTAEFSNEDILAIQNSKIPQRAKTILNRLKISEEEALQSFNQDQLNPSPRINLYKTTSGQTILDARYYYRAPSLESVIEASAAFITNKTLITTRKLSVTEINLLKQNQIEISSMMPTEPHKNTLLIIYDSKKSFNHELDLLLNAN